MSALLTAGLLSAMMGGSPRNEIADTVARENRIIELRAVLNPHLAEGQLMAAIGGGLDSESEARCFDQVVVYRQALQNAGLAQMAKVALVSGFSQGLSGRRTATFSTTVDGQTHTATISYQDPIAAAEAGDAAGQAYAARTRGKALSKRQAIEVAGAQDLIASGCWNSLAARTVRFQAEGGVL